MSLPDRSLKTDIVVVGDDKVQIRSLSRSEAIRIQGFAGDLDAAENFILACGADVTEDEARAWRANVSAEDGGVVIDAICELSGLVEGAQKSN